MPEIRTRLHDHSQQSPGARTFEAQLDDGSWLHISERRTKDGGYVSVGTDITRIKEHEQKLIENDGHLRANVLDLKRSQAIYDHVDGIARRLGADPQDQVPFAKYAKAAESLLKPSSAARAVASGAPFIERVDLLVKLVSDQLGASSAEIDATVQTVDQKLNEKIVAGGSGAT